MQHLEVDDADAIDVPCRAGGATAHDFSTVHGSGPNLGERVRRAWVLDFTTGPWHQRLAKAGQRRARAAGLRCRSAL